MNYLPKTKKRIAVAMSGGVDSSVVAYLLAQEGHELIGLTAWTLNGPGKCCNDALVNAGRVCEMLSMPYDTVDLRAEFSHFVMDYYNNSYEAGLTPNPCVECNRYVKWEKLVDYARKELGVDYVATGHYAKLRHGTEGQVQVFRSRDEHKDQTYMMARVYPKDLQYTIFPLGDYVKPEVLEIARNTNLPTAYSKESQDVCFVLNGQANYMADVFGVRPGPIVDVDTGHVVGEHEGHFRYTVGQRKGVKVAAGRPIYVIRVDAATNTVYVGDAVHLETSEFRALSVNWLEAPEGFLSGAALEQPVEMMVKIRYNTPPKLAQVMRDPASPEGNVIVRLNEPLPAITPGQIAAFYDPSFSQLLGGGYIEKYLSHRTFDPDSAKPLPDLHCSLAGQRN